jgi:hypothetical protein
MRCPGSTELSASERSIHLARRRPAAGGFLHPLGAAGRGVQNLIWASRCPRPAANDREAETPGPRRVAGTKRATLLAVGREPTSL